MEWFVPVLVALVGLIATQDTNKKNQENVEATNQQNADLTQEAWERDDNAVQRRKADLIAAGLSPVLAAGSAAGNTNPISASSFKADALPFESLVNSMFKSQDFNLRREMQNVQIDKVEAEIDQMNTMKDLAEKKYQADLNKDLFMMQQAYSNNMMRNALLEAQIGEIGANREYLNNRFIWQKAIEQANYELQLSKYQMEYFNNHLWWSTGQPFGGFGMDVLSRLGGMSHVLAQNLDKLLGNKSEYPDMNRGFNLSNVFGGY